MNCKEDKKKGMGVLDDTYHKMEILCDRGRIWLKLDNEKIIDHWPADFRHLFCKSR